MNRPRFLRNLFGLSLLPVWGCQIDKSKATPANSEGNEASLEKPTSIEALRQELICAWDRSENMTMINVEQMPSEFFKFKYTDEAMTFAEQWRHCVIFTCGQLSVRAGIKNPYEGIKLPVQMPKEDVIQELKSMYIYVRTCIMQLSEQKLLSTCDFAGDTIPLWRLFYALENHIIHHRGQCVVYLRLNGIVPKGYYGW